MVGGVRFATAGTLIRTHHTTSLLPSYSNTHPIATAIRLLRHHRPRRRHLLLSNIPTHFASPGLFLPRTMDHHGQPSPTIPARSPLDRETVWRHIGSPVPAGRSVSSVVSSDHPSSTSILSSSLASTQYTLLPPTLCLRAPRSSPHSWLATHVQGNVYLPFHMEDNFSLVGTCTLLTPFIHHHPSLTPLTNPPPGTISLAGVVGVAQIVFARCCPSHLQQQLLIEQQRAHTHSSLIASSELISPRIIR